MTRTGPWTTAFDEDCATLVATIVGEPPPARDVAWRQLLERIGPRIEAWALRNGSLRRCGLTGIDEARTVLVQVLTRLKANDFETLRCFVERRTGAGDDDEADEARVVESAARIAALADGDPEPAALPGDGDESAGTPFRGWLLTVVRFAVKDHLRQRLGWTAPAPDAPGKRDLNTNAERLTTDVGGSARPPVTDLLTLGRFVAQVHEAIAGFPAAMRRAVELWLDGSDFEQIGRALALAGPRAPDDEARALVRAGQARLRQRFRDEWGPVFGRGRGPS